MPDQPLQRIDGAIAKMADALQVLVLSVESCQRDLTVGVKGDSLPNLYAVNRRLVAIATEMQSIVQSIRQLRGPEGGTVAT